ncbi:hypothetical protein [Bacillus marasmi]|uniref:hypothetical protein n=1 Tax=Bacillus marasmi TaxID=1926279 RepID=UPI0011C85DE5|nr:hypothetical protein [Bacillus marasmi]
MDKLIAKLYDITLMMKQSLDEEDYEKLNELLDIRNMIIAEIEVAKTEHHQYSQQAKLLLREMNLIDTQVTHQLIKAHAETESLINQQKINKQVSKKFQPYSKQTSGVFLDEKK